ncbi:MAG: hypothetical protein JW774_07145 [Candidatus Aureabacteria bacterium]|nr:hypothetical protein [Candidatus Auribacterota bacterium]
MMIILIGTGIGALMGYHGKCSTGACPLTANPYRGALYGAIMSILFVMSMNPGRLTRSGANAPSNVTEKGKPASQVLHINNKEVFQQDVIHSELPCVADFYSDYCGPCRKLGPVMENLAQKYQGKVRICKVSMDAVPELARSYQISSIPAVLFFNRGKEVKRLVGLRDQSAYETILDSMVLNITKT